MSFDVSASLGWFTEHRIALIAMIISVLSLIIGIMALVRTHLFSRARLRIEHHSTNQGAEYQPEQTYLTATGQFIRDQKYLRIKIRNNGLAVASDCRGQLRAIIPRNANQMNYPSNVWKDLAFGNTPDKRDLSDLRQIHPRGGEELLHIVFSDTHFPNILLQGAPQRLASVSIIDHMNNNDTNVANSFALGIFILQIRVLSDTGRCGAHFILQVGNNSFRDLRMRRLSWRESLGFRFGRLPNI